MVNMNKYRDPCIYSLVDEAGVPFYIGRTLTNAQNRLWEHNYRAKNGHPAPVYKRMREIGVDRVSYRVLRRLSDSDDARELEAEYIMILLNEGNDLANALGRDGRPDSWSEEQRRRGQPSRKGKPTWIKGKTGVEAGWTDERRARQSETMRLRRNAKIYKES